MEAALRDYYSECGVDQACPDAALYHWAPWGWPEWLLVLLGFILLIGLLMAVFSKAPVKKPDAASKIVTDTLNKYEAEAQRWGKPEAAASILAARNEIQMKFSEAGIK
jgi:hypothetical protein